MSSHLESASQAKFRKESLHCCLSLSGLVLKYSKRKEVTVGEKGDVRREAAGIGEELGGGSMHAANDG